MARARQPRRTRRDVVPPIRLDKRVTWRDPSTGRRVARPRPGQRFPRGQRPRPETRLVQLDPRGRILRTVEMLTRTKVIKTSVAGTVGAVDTPLGASNRGLVHIALGHTNVFTKLKGTKRITVLVTGRDPSGRKHKIKHSMFTMGIKRIDDLLITGIIGAMRKHGFRTQYALEQVDWSRVRPVKRDWHGRTINTKSFVRTLKPLHDVDIQVTLEK